MGRTKTIADEQILRRAREVFRAGGHGASTREVARAVGISQAVLYQRFGSKEELFARAMHPDPPELDALLGAYVPGDAQLELRRTGERLGDYLAALMPTLIHVLALPGLSRERVLAVHHELAFGPLVAGLTERFRRLRADGAIGEVDPPAVARTFLAVVHAAVLFEAMLHGGERAPAREHAGALLEVLWTGLAPRGAENPVAAGAKG